MRKIKVTALIAYEIRGVRSYKEIAYQVYQWHVCMTVLFTTNEWIRLRELLDANYADSKVRGITFNFTDNE